MCKYAPVAQLDRVSGYEPEGRAFESLRVRQEPIFRRAHRLAVRTSPFHGGNGGSIPPGRAKFSKPALLKAGFFYCVFLLGLGIYFERWR